MLKIDFENQILALFDGYFWPFNNSQEKIKSIFAISAIIPSIWNVFIKFRWHDEKLTRPWRLENERAATGLVGWARLGWQPLDISSTLRLWFWFWLYCRKIGGEICQPIFKLLHITNPECWKLLNFFTCDFFFRIRSLRSRKL